MRLAQALLIHKFFLKASRSQWHTDRIIASEWQLALGEPLTEAIHRLKTEHLIAPAYSEPYPVEAFHAHDIAFMWDIRTKDPPRSGEDRTERINRLHREHPLLISSVFRDLDYCIATAAGRALAQTFLDAWHFARHHALHAFRKGDIHQTMQARSHLLKELGFFVGMPLAKPRPGAWFEHLLKAAPTILSSLPSSTTEDLRSELALESLFGNEDSSQQEKEWDSAESLLVPFSRSHARDLFDIAATARFKLDCFRRIGATHVTITSGYRTLYGGPRPPDPCKACQLQIGTVLPIDAAPELPHPACTNSLGCRCTFSMSRPPN